MTYSSVIFDLDGTLLDSLEGLANTCNNVLVSHNFPTHPLGAYQEFVGDGLEILMVRCLPKYTSHTVVLQCCIMFKELYALNWKKTCCAYDGIETMLTTLRKAGCKLSVLSNKPHEFTRLIVKEMFPADMFAVVYGQREGLPKKPDPSVALEIARHHGCSPRETLFVGDTGIDIQTGKAALMVTAGVSWGFRTVQELQDNSADLIVHHPSELVEYVLSSS